MTEAAPELPKMNIFLMEWRHETPKLMQIYDSARDPGWSPNKLPWDTLKPEELTPDQLYAISYWFALLAVFDASGPAVFSRAVIHTYETHEKEFELHGKFLRDVHAALAEGHEAFFALDCRREPKKRGCDMIHSTVRRQFVQRVIWRFIALLALISGCNAGPPDGNAGESECPGAG